MTTISAIIEWFEQCPYVSDVKNFDIDQLSDETDIAAIYRQPEAVDVAFNDGTVLRTEHYYLLFKKYAQVKDTRESNTEFGENVEQWVRKQNLEGNFPNISHDVDEIKLSNAVHLYAWEGTNGVYQLTIEITFMI